MFKEIGRYENCVKEINLSSIVVTPTDKVKNLVFNLINRIII